MQIFAVPANLGFDSPRILTNLHEWADAGFVSAWLFKGMPHLPAKAGWSLQDLGWSALTWAPEASFFTLTGLPAVRDLVWTRDFCHWKYLEKQVLDRLRCYLMIDKLMSGSWVTLREFL